jgi:hypothetical protein
MKTKLLFTVMLALIIGLSANATTPNWQWVNGTGGTAEEAGSSICTDTQGNVLVLGRFASPTITFGTTILTNTGGFDLFVVKYDPAGNVLWATSAIGTSNEWVSAISTDANGNVLITGGFQSPTMTIGTTMLTNADNNGSSDAIDVFVYKLDASGNVLWAKSAGGGGNISDQASDITADLNGNVYVTGTYVTAKIGFGTDSLVNVGSADIFTVKYDPAGNVLWAKSAGGSSGDNSRSISIDPSGNILITGYYQSATINFGSTALTNTNNSGSPTDIFVTKYDASGNVLWAQTAGSMNSNEEATSISADINGNILVAGNFQGGHITFAGITLTNPDSANFMAMPKAIFIVKFDAAGSVIWAKSPLGTTANAGSSLLSTDASGNIYLTGNFTSKNLMFDSITLTNTDSIPMFGNGTQEIFVAKYDASGNAIWAKSVIGSYWDEVYGIGTDATGNTFITGSFYSSKLIFGTDTLTNIDNSQVTVDYYVAKLSDIAPTGIQEENNLLTATIFPNPFSSQTIITSSYIFHNATLTIYNINGQQVKQIPNISTQSIIFNRDNLSPGLYFIKLTQDNKTLFIEKLIITDN